MKAISMKDTAIIAYQFFYWDSNHDVSQWMIIEWFVKTNTYLSFKLWSDSYWLLYKFIFLSVNLDNTSKIILSVTEVRECVATVILHKDELAKKLSSKIFILFIIEHTISSYYLKC